MANLLLWLGRVAGVVGITVCVVAAGARLSGQYILAGFELGTLFQAGTSAMIAGCFCLLSVMTIRSKGES